MLHVPSASAAAAILSHEARGTHVSREGRQGAGSQLGWLAGLLTMRLRPLMRRPQRRQMAPSHCGSPVARGRAHADRHVSGVLLRVQEDFSTHPDLIDRAARGGTRVSASSSKLQRAAAHTVHGRWVWRARVWSSACCQIVRWLPATHTARERRGPQRTSQPLRARARGMSDECRAVCGRVSAHRRGSLSLCRASACRSRGYLCPHRGRETCMTHNQTGGSAGLRDVQKSSAVTAVPMRTAVTTQFLHSALV